MKLVYSRVFYSALIASGLVATKPRAYAQQANYRASFIQNEADCKFGKALTSQGTWHDENSSDQLILEKISAISVKIKSVGSAVCFSELFDKVEEDYKILIYANSRKQNACSEKFVEAMRNYKLDAALYFSAKELAALQRIMIIETYAGGKEQLTESDAEAMKAFSESKEEVTDLKDHAKDLKKAGHIANLLLQNRKSAAASDLLEFLAEKAGDKIKDTLKELDREMSVAYVVGKYDDWQFKKNISLVEDTSVMECN